jgi:small subunit ribosomal protein S21
MVTVLVQDDNLERAIRKFRKEVDKENILQEYRDRRYFEKPSAKKHQKNVSLKRKFEKEAEAAAKERK